MPSRARNCAPPCSRAEHVGVKRERRQTRAPALRVRRAARRAAAKIGLFAGFARAAPRAADPCASIGEREELVIVETEQRAFQHGRQRQIVVRQQQRIAEHQQIHDGDMLGQHQPVGAGDIDGLAS